MAFEFFGFGQKDKEPVVQSAEVLPEDRSELSKTVEEMEAHAQTVEPRDFAIDDAPQSLDESLAQPDLPTHPSTEGIEVVEENIDEITIEAPEAGSEDKAA